LIVLSREELAGATAPSGLGGHGGWWQRNCFGLGNIVPLSPGLAGQWVDPSLGDINLTVCGVNPLLGLVLLGVRRTPIMCQLVVFVTRATFRPTLDSAAPCHT
jgi:hypothetical protein